MIEQVLKRRLRSVARRIRSYRMWLALAVWWALCAAAGMALHWRGAERLGGWLWVWLAIVLAGTAAVAWLAGRSPDLRRVARRIEERFPDLRFCLVTAVEQQPSGPTGRLSYLQERVVQQALLHGYKRPWQWVVGGWKMLAARAAGLCALAAIGLLFVVLLGDWRRFEPPPAPVASTSGGAATRVTVEPGDVEVERGSSLLVVARFDGPLPATAKLVYQTASGVEHELPMSRSLEDPIFGGRIAVVEEPLTYAVKFEGRQSERYRVSVFEYPELLQANARLIFPEYTGMSERTMKDVRHLSAVVGTRVVLECVLNKPVAEGHWVAADGRRLALEPTADRPSIATAQWTIEKSERLKLQLVDAEGRRNRYPPELTIQALPNQPPAVRVVRPARDVEVSPLEELEVQARVWDDFGVVRFGLSYALAGQPPREAVVLEQAAGQKQHEVSHIIAMEDLSAEPDQLLTYYWWAEDYGPDGQLRRVMSDMYLAEVRPFEEIYREGQQPPGGSGPQQQNGNAQRAEQLAELQKQIINATWTLVRRKLADPAAEIGGDVRLVIESQLSALQQLLALGQRLTDPQSLRHVDQVQRAMQQAVEQLEQAESDQSVGSLEAALAAEQAAYAGLLKLRAREHQVVRSRSGQPGSMSRSPRSQMQLQQLQLRNQDNRYETQRTARPQDEQQQREDRQALNRLRELARRQGDLNRQIQQLQSALEEATNPAQRDQLRRQLERLQEEQRQILRDTDELRQRMQQPQNQQRMADARQQLDQTRERVREASEALREGQLSRAAAAGTRAEREFEQLRDEFRRRSAGQFAEQMQQLREAARQLDETQQQLGRQLRGEDRQGERAPSLRESDPSQQVAEQLEQQKERLGQLLEQIKQTVQESEPTQPLLADELYETYRQARQRQLDEQLDAVARWVRRGLLDDARTQEQAARQGIRQLREGVERAATRVLGDDVEALRQARDELEWLRNALEQELARNQPQQESADADRSAPRGRRAGEPQRGDPQSADERDGDRPPEQPEGRQRPPRSDGQEREGQATQPSEQPAQQGGASEPQDQQRRGEPADGESRDGQRGRQSPAEAERSGQQRGQPGRPGQGRQPGDVAGPLRGFDRLLERATQFAPIGGGNFPEWSDRLRDVEEMLTVPELRAEAARIREQARAIRADMRRHSKPPNWDLVRLRVARPLAELEQRVAEEILRRTAKDALVPIDRDPVPPPFEDPVRLYYEQLGSGRAPSGER